MRRFYFALSMMLLAWLGCANAFADVVVTKVLEKTETSDTNVGVVPPVGVTVDGFNKFKVTYGSSVKKARVDILESGRVVYSDADRQPGNTVVNYSLGNVNPDATYVVRVETDGVVRAVDEIPVND